MEVGHVFLWLVMMVLGACNEFQSKHISAGNEEEERALLKMESFLKMKQTEEFKSGVPDLLTKVGGIGDLVQIDYKQPPKQVMKALGDSVVPIIATGLALIPGGAVIGGIVSGIWGLLSPLFGGDGKSPMERMIDDIRDDLNNLQNDVAALRASLNDTIRKHIDEKLSQLLDRAINSELRRNEYICAKYAILSKVFSDDFKNNRTISDTIRSEMVAQIHDCDDFLKDSADAFVYPEFADVLWVPSVITTLVRAAFLTEVSNYGFALKIEPEMIVLFLKEIKSDIRRAFQFAGLAVQKKLELFHAMTKEERSILHEYTTNEYEGCVMQAQLLYMDREMYPYGVPKLFPTNKEERVLVLADYNVTEREERHHILISINKGLRLNDNMLLNCFIGPATTQFIIKHVLLRVSFAVNKTYELRVLYFIKEIKFGTGIEYGNGNVNVTVHYHVRNQFDVEFRKGKPNEDGRQRYVLNTGYHAIRYAEDKSNSQRNKRLMYTGNGAVGKYVVESLCAFNIQSSSNKGGFISATVYDKDVILLGFELLTFPLHKDE